MKKFLPVLLVLVLLTGCGHKGNTESVTTPDGVLETTAPEASERETTPEPTQADTTSPETEYDDSVTLTSYDENGRLIAYGIGPYWDWREDLKTRPDGKEVTIFADNTFDCDYTGYKEIGYSFGSLYRSVMAPEGWNGFRFYNDIEPFENELTGIPIYDGEIPVKIDYQNESTLYAAMPMEKSTFYLAESPWIRAQDFIDDGNGLIDKFDHETYTDKNGRTMQIYYIDGLPKYICYDDYYNLCIWLNVKSEDQIPVIVNMVNSVDVYTEQ